MAAIIVSEVRDSVQFVAPLFHKFVKMGLKVGPELDLKVGPLMENLCGLSLSAS